MNLQNITRGAIQGVSPMLNVTLKRSIGYARSGDGLRTPSYATPITVQAQVQALDANDLRQISGINQQGEKIAIYVNGTLLGEVRPDGAGGDIILMPDGSTWLVIKVLENWGTIDGWTKVVCVRQVDTSIAIPLDN